MYFGNATTISIVARHLPLAMLVGNFKEKQTDIDGPVRCYSPILQREEHQNT
jgi:hypothetical protein